MLFAYAPIRETVLRLKDKITGRTAGYKVSELFNSVVEMKWREDVQEWHIQNLRPDKRKPNSYRTALNTWQHSILNPISLQDVFPFMEQGPSPSD